MFKSVNELVDNISNMKIRGANKIAIESLKFLRDFCKKKGFRKEFQTAVKKLQKTRPTAVVLHNCLETVKK
jgi:translation initiation factor 2B subunit (eIF-2B alpha/beta/delta family)